MFVGILIGIAVAFVILGIVAVRTPKRRGTLTGRALEDVEAQRANALLTSQQGHFNGGFGI